TALLLCVVFFFGSGLLSYYLGTVATSGRTPTAAVAWDKILSLRAWLQLFEHHSLCQGYTRLILCIQESGGWMDIVTLVGAVVRGGRLRCGGGGCPTRRAYSHRRCRSDRLYRSRARLRLCVSGRVARASPHTFSCCRAGRWFACLRSFPSSSHSAGCNSKHP